MDEDTQRHVSFLRELHYSTCFEAGDHPDERDTAYSVGADAIERLAAIDAKPNKP